MPPATFYFPGVTGTEKLMYLYSPGLTGPGMESCLKADVKSSNHWPHVLDYSMRQKLRVRQYHALLDKTMEPWEVKILIKAISE